MSTDTLTLGAAYLPITLSAADHTLLFDFPDGFDMTGTWGLWVRDSARASGLALEATLAVDGQTLSHPFDWPDLLDLIPHRGEGAERVYTADTYTGVYVICQGDEDRFSGPFTVLLTARHGGE